MGKSKKKHHKKAKAACSTNRHDGSQQTSEATAYPAGHKPETVPNVYWTAIDMATVRMLPRFVGLPDLRIQLDDGTVPAACLKFVRQEDPLWQAAHVGVLTTGIITDVLGFKEERVARRLGCAQQAGHQRMVTAVQHLKQPHMLSFDDTEPMHTQSQGNGQHAAACHVVAAAEALVLANAGKDSSLEQRCMPGPCATDLITPMAVEVVVSGCTAQAAGLTMFGAGAEPARDKGMEPIVLNAVSQTSLAARPEAVEAVVPRPLPAAVPGRTELQLLMSCIQLAQNGLSSIQQQWGHTQEGATVYGLMAMFPQAVLHEVGMCVLPYNHLPSHWRQRLPQAQLPPLAASPDALICHPFTITAPTGQMRTGGGQGQSGSTVSNGGSGLQPYSGFQADQQCYVNGVQRQGIAQQQYKVVDMEQQYSALSTQQRDMTGCSHQQLVQQQGVKTGMVSVGDGSSNQLQQLQASLAGCAAGRCCCKTSSLGGSAAVHIHLPRPEPAQQCNVNQGPPCSGYSSRPPGEGAVQLCTECGALNPASTDSGATDGEQRSSTCIDPPWLRSLKQVCQRQLQQLMEKHVQLAALPQVSAGMPANATERSEDMDADVDEGEGEGDQGMDEEGRGEEGTQGTGMEGDGEEDERDPHSVTQGAYAGAGSGEETDDNSLADPEADQPMLDQRHCSKYPRSDHPRSGADRSSQQDVTSMDVSGPLQGVTNAAAQMCLQASVAAMHGVSSLPTTSTAQQHTMNSHQLQPSHLGPEHALQADQVPLHQMLRSGQLSQQLLMSGSPLLLLPSNHHAANGAGSNPCGVAVSATAASGAGTQHTHMGSTAMAGTEVLCNGGSPAQAEAEGTWTGAGVAGPHVGAAMGAGAILEVVEVKNTVPFRLMARKTGARGRTKVSYTVGDRGPRTGVAPYWVPQLQLHMLATGTQSALLVSRSITKGIAVYRLWRDDEYLFRMLNTVSRVYTQYVVPGRSVPVNALCGEPGYQSLLDNSIRLARSAQCVARWQGPAPVFPGADTRPLV